MRIFFGIISIFSHILIVGIPSATLPICWLQYYIQLIHEWNIFRVTGSLWQRPVTRNFDYGFVFFDLFFDLRLSKRLSKPSRRRWFETASRSLWRHCNVFGAIVCPSMNLNPLIWLGCISLQRYNYPVSKVTSVYNSYWITMWGPFY